MQSRLTSGCPGRLASLRRCTPDMHAPGGATGFLPKSCSLSATARRLQSIPRDRSAMCSARLAEGRGDTSGNRTAAPHKRFAETSRKILGNPALAARNPQSDARLEDPSPETGGLGMGRCLPYDRPTRPFDQAGGGRGWSGEVATVPNKFHSQTRVYALAGTKYLGMYVHTLLREAMSMVRNLVCNALLQRCSP